MKRTITILSAAAIALAMAGPVMAQQLRRDAGNADINYFDSHPEVSRALRKDPSLIDNQQFVDHHPGLHEYLHSHPNVRNKFKSHPNEFIHHEERYHKNHG